ncbi:MFS transporter [Desulfosporosinus sp. PR]|uniref:MFS transporter n=1 Tax=Candidatus Desulfosporosinus nitrosoreducens TaxID=3401928 RepID=UPI0027ECAB32|nr:MFS transporter [Desulfosporosinus sp. PR]MDQ7094040.1 MFS transporter [Desulfosporosinus sp. PR]
MSTRENLAVINGTQTIPSQEKDSLLNQPKAVWAVFFASIIAFMGLGLVDPILSLIAEDLHASQSQVTLLFTSYNGVMAIAAIITGAISSRIGAKWTLMCGTVIIALFSALGGLSNSIWAIVGWRAGWGFGNALFVATALVAIISLSKGGNAKAIILYEAAIGLGISVGPLLGGWLGGFSWRGPFLGVAFLMVIAFFAVLAFMPTIKSQTTAKQGTSFAEPFYAMKHRSLVVFGIGAALYNFGFFTVLAYAPFVMGLDVHGLGYVFLTWGIFLALTSVFTAPKLQQWMGTVKAMCLMFTLFAVLLLAIGIWTNIHWVPIVAVILSGAVMGNNNTLVTTAVMNAAPVERSTASSAYNFLRFLGAAVAPYMAGKLAERFNPHVPFITAAVFVIFAGLIVGLNYHHIKHVDHVGSSH